MVEELYVISNNKRYRLDLSLPSGITLNFKSNIFGDLSKITASYSYTFKLPMTANNRMVMDMAEDVRHSSAMIRKRLKCEYIQNGIPLFSNANLYIDSVESGYNAVMTWGVVEGFQKLKDDDCSLNELPHIETIVLFGSTSAYKTIGESNNNAMVLQPEYSCGLPYRIMERTRYEGYRSGTYYYSYNHKDDRYYRGCYYSAKPFPVVPIRHLINTINAVFEINIQLGNDFNYSDYVDGYDKTQRYDLINRGVIPCVEKNLTYEQSVSRKAVLSNFGFVNDNVAGDTLDKAIYIQEEDEDILSILTFGSVSTTNSDSPFSGTQSKDSKFLAMDVSLSDVTAKCYGRLLVTFNDYHTSGRGTGTASRSDGSSSTTEGPTLRILQYRTASIINTGATGTRRVKYKVVELASVSGESIGVDANGYYQFEFDFREFEGLEEVEISDLTATRIYFTFDSSVRSVSGTSIEIIPDYSNVLGGHYMDVYSNLPGISCQTFVKSIFFMLGAFPTANENGDIIPVFYNDLKNNLYRAKDWSKKVMTADWEAPSKILYKAGDVAQRNYYMTKSDDLSISDEDARDITDIYASGIGVIECENEVLDVDKTIIQLPFSAPFILNKKTPRYDTGSTFKAYEYKDKEFKFSEPTPIVGLIDKDIVTTYTKDISSGAVLSTETESRWTMKCWNGFAELDTNPSFAYLKKILADPFLVTEYLNLNEFDLKELDYAVPVYLSKYNSYFAIVSITRDSKGKCKCELLKLPNE